MSLFLQLRRGRATDGRDRWPLDGTDAVVGSDPACDVVLDGLAPRHFQFGHRAGRWMVVDLGSGTRLDGAPLDRPAPVGPGSTVEAGPCLLAVTDRASLPTSPPPGAPLPGAPLPGSEAGPAAALLAAAGLDRAALAGSDAELLAAAGRLLRALTDGVASQLARRERDKAEIGADRTAFAPGGLNPLKVLPGDRALAALLTGGARSEPQVAEAFADLDAHATATLTAMQGALGATLDRFSPASIRGRAQAGGVMARVLPHAREAALWTAYEREFDGVRGGSADAFVEMFAKAFAEAYRAAGR